MPGRVQPLPAFPSTRRRRSRAAVAGIHGHAIQTGSVLLQAHSSLTALAVTQRPQQIILGQPGLASYAERLAQEPVESPPFVTSTVTVSALIDGIYDS